MVSAKRRRRKTNPEIKTSDGRLIEVTWHAKLRMKSRSIDPSSIISKVVDLPYTKSVFSWFDIKSKIEIAYVDTEDKRLVVTALRRSSKIASLGRQPKRLKR